MKHKRYFIIGKSSAISHKDIKFIAYRMFMKWTLPVSEKLELIIDCDYTVRSQTDIPTQLQKRKRLEFMPLAKFLQIAKRQNDPVIDDMLKKVSMPLKPDPVARVARKDYTKKPKSSTLKIRISETRKKQNSSFSPHLPDELSVYLV